MSGYTDLIDQALSKVQDSYAPYSHYHVAAALLSSDGRVFHGINIENAAYTPTVCAERTAFFKAVSEGARSFDAIAVVAAAKSDLPARMQAPAAVPYYPTPCGVCRQVMREFCDPETFTVILARSADDYKVYTLKELLPESFGPEFLQT
ncbi:MAG: cytidine deaminase [Lachnospiraceae bacterium]|nr:cytidine deaminase [Lachnospiraceae bacterium]